jgi:hypothetical protein
MNVDKIASMALGDVVAPKIAFGKVRAVAAALVAVKAPGLLVTLAAIIACPARQDAMPPHEVRIMVERDALGLVAGVAVFYFHRRIICMRLFAGR